MGNINSLVHLMQAARVVRWLASAVRADARTLRKDREATKAEQGSAGSSPSGICGTRAERETSEPRDGCAAMDRERQEWLRAAAAEGFCLAVSNPEVPHRSQSQPVLANSSQSQLAPGAMRLSRSAG